MWAEELRVVMWPCIASASYPLTTSCLPGHHAVPAVRQVIKANDDLTPEHHQFFLYQMLRGLKYIHSAKVGGQVVGGGGSGVWGYTVHDEIAHHFVRRLVHNALVHQCHQLVQGRGD